MRASKLITVVIAACSSIGLAQVVTAPDEVQILRQQIGFFEQALTVMGNQYDRTIGFLTWLLPIFFGGTLIAGGLGVYGVFKSVKRRLEAYVYSTISKELGEKIQQRIRLLEEIVDREEAPRQARICYVRISDGLRPSEYDILDAGRFKDLSFSSSVAESAFDCEIVVLDLRGLTDAQLEDTVEQSSAVVDINQVLVLFAPGIKIPAQLFEKVPENFIIAQMPVTLFNACIEGAHYVQVRRRSLAA